MTNWNLNRKCKRGTSDCQKTGENWDVGVVTQAGEYPMREERWYAVKGRDAWYCHGSGSFVHVHRLKWELAQ